MLKKAEKHLNTNPLIRSRLIMVSKKYPKVFDEIEGFLPENFEKILTKIRNNKRKGICPKRISKANQD